MEYIFLSSLEGGKIFGSKGKQEGALKEAMSLTLAKSGSVK